MRRLTYLAAAAAATGALALIPLAAASTPAASATTTSTKITAQAGSFGDNGWAGYYATPPGKQPLYEVTATFTVPDVSHMRVVGLRPYDVAMWAGIGGINGASLAQAGLFINKDHAWSKPEYVLFHEVAPRENVEPYLNKDKSFVTIKPGTQIAAVVSAPLWNGTGKWEFTIYVNPESLNPTIYSWAEALPASVKIGRTAEVITEWPSNGIQHAPFTGGMINSGKVTYTSADYLTQSGPKPDPVPVTQYKIYLNTGWHALLAKIYPSNATASYSGQPTIKDSFYTYTNIKK